MIVATKPIVLITRIEMAFLDMPVDYGQFWRADFAVDGKDVRGVLHFRRHGKVQVLLPVGCSLASLSRYVEQVIARKFKRAVRLLERQE